MAAKGARESITLACSDCKRRNYTTEKNKKNTTDRLESSFLILYFIEFFKNLLELSLNLSSFSLTLSKLICIFITSSTFSVPLNILSFKSTIPNNE